MLVLSRKRGEIIDIGENIRIEVLDIRHDQIRLGIDAPKDVTVHRREVTLEIERQNREQKQCP